MCDILNQSSQTVKTVVSNHEEAGEGQLEQLEDRVNHKIAEGVKKAVHLITSKFDTLL